MQIPEIERMLDDLEAAANAVEAYGAARPLPWRIFLGGDEDAGAFVTLTPDQTRRLVTVARAYLRPPTDPARPGDVARSRHALG
jgi:hypothetical protein